MRPVRLIGGVGVIAMLVLASCAQPQITRRYASIAEPEKDGAPKTKLTILADIVPADSSPSQTVAQTIGDRAQEAIAKAAIEKSDAGPAAAVKVLTQRIGDSGAPQTDFSKFSRRIVTVIGADLGDADRIESAIITIEMDQNAKAAFGPVKQWVTDYQTVDFGTMKLDRGSTLSAELGLAPPTPLVSGLTLGGEIKETLSESIALKREIPHLTIHRENESRRMVLRHEGALGLSLVGATGVDVTVIAASRPSVLTFVDGLAPAKPADTANVRFTNVTYPAAACGPVTATVSLSATVRRVTNGAATYTESDDVVVRERPKAEPVRLELISTSDLTRRVWFITETRRGGEKGDRISVGDPDGSVVTLGFADLAQAETVLAWMRTHRQPTLGGRPLYLGDPNTPPARASGRPIRSINKNDPVFGTLTIDTDFLNTQCQ